MDDSELFDVFSIGNNPEPVQKTAPGIHRQKSKKSKKPDTDKKATASDASTDVVIGKRPYDEGNDKSNDIDGGESTQVSKKPRKRNDTPIVVDSFETESDQIVPATQGLQGLAPPDHNIVIKKRVFFCEIMLIVVSPCCSFPYD